MHTRHLPNRRSLLASLIVISSSRVALAKPCATPKVLFVCPAGTVKSAIAREELRRRAQARGIAVSVQSRGIHPEDHVSVALKGNLEASGIKTDADPLMSFVPQDARRADIVIAFDEAADAPGLNKARRWNIPSWNSEYAKAKAKNDVMIEALLDEIAARRC